MLFYLLLLLFGVVAEQDDDLMSFVTVCFAPHLTMDRPANNHSSPEYEPSNSTSPIMIVTLFPRGTGSSRRME